MKISIGSDHRGVEVRQSLIETLESWDYQIVDCGSFGTESCDYPDIAREVCERLVAGEVERGILLCGTGIGMSIAANKIRGIRAAVCNDLKSAEMSRRHNDANVLCLSADIMAERSLDDVVKRWLETEFEGGRHQRRVDKIGELFQWQRETTAE